MQLSSLYVQVHGLQGMPGACHQQAVRLSTRPACTSVKDFHKLAPRPSLALRLIINGM